MRIKLYDLMGVKSGMNFYLEAFDDLLEKHNIKTYILSNFSYKSNKQYLPNVFARSPVKKIVNLLTCYIKLLVAIAKLKKDEGIIVLLYGVILDIPLFIIAKLSKRVVIDVHEIMALDYKNQFLRKTLHYFYKTCTNTIIVHSDKIYNVISGVSGRVDIISVPLFPNYNEHTYDINHIGEDVKDVFKFKDDRLKYFLFFGNVRPSKGIFDLLAATELLKDEPVKIIIAGQDIFNTIKEYKKDRQINDSVLMVLRLINDDEMKYFFMNSHVTLLPYTSISQSGVLQTAVSLKTPLLTSDIDYFKQVINSFPSFGSYTNTTDPVVFKNSLVSFASGVSEKQYYSQEDIDKYYDSAIFDAFVSRLKEAVFHEA